ncbi:hypothetical protein AVEN_243681-1 [Araneus ventricosus]|uniref:Tethering factor for nuclear proteasome STS1 n=1 Tax=Araneus ventricosus TaxID=182803 RepID=A0A4Y2A4U6_ARAVE|nr:hypothetical protein AVEN_243681-1 [Araneus ventricosus]
MAGSAGRRNILRELGQLANGSGIHSPLQEASPISPDETVIQQRGLRRKSPTYNYDAPDPVFFKTPTKSPKKSRFLTPTKTTPVRSSPRKRPNGTPDKMRFSEAGISEISLTSKCYKKSPLKNVKPGLQLEKGLKALSHNQLVELIADSINCNPEIEGVINKMLPVPDLAPAEERLHKLKQNVFRSYPRNVWGSQDSSFCFMRIKTHLEAFKKDCLEMCQLYMDSEHWPTAFEFIFAAWKYTSELPDWDYTYHNRIKSVCMKHLAAQCITALKKANLDKPALAEIIERMQEYASESAVKPCIAFAVKLMEEMV